MSVPESVPEIVAFCIRTVLQLQYESTAIQHRFPSSRGDAYSFSIPPSPVPLRNVQFVGRSSAAQII
jgi:hypothetical protein